MKLSAQVPVAARGVLPPSPRARTGFSRPYPRGRRGLVVDGSDARRVRLAVRNAVVD